MSPWGLSVALAAFVRTRALARRLRTRAALMAFQAARLKRFLTTVAPAVPFYAPYRGQPLAALPIMDKTAVMAHFAELNVAGVSAAGGFAAVASGARVRGLHVGASTGTSGNRGLFVVSERERFVWLGVMLAKTLPDFPWVAHKVALALPANSALYRSASDSGRLALRFFDLRDGVEAWADQLEQFAPDVVMAPPKALRALAARDGPWSPRHVFSGAEVLDPLDRCAIEARWGVKVREIYQATEGLFGVACAEGVMHLAEDAVAFEWEAAAGLMAPMVTDFTRQAQIMARYRMNDLLELSPEPCACGSPLQAVTAIHGRRDDAFELPAAAGGGLALITPDVVRNAVVGADPRITDFTVRQLGPALIELALADEALFVPAAGALTAGLARAGAGEVSIHLAPLAPTPYTRKLRRVERVWRPAASGGHDPPNAQVIDDRPIQP